MTIAIFGVAGWLFALEGLPNRLAGMFHSMTSSTILFLLLVNLILLLLGLVVEPLPLVIIMAPLLLPVAVSYHVDPVQFGVMFTLNVMLGLLHPPIGLNMFIASHIAKASVGEFTVAVLPFLLALLIVLALVTYIPAVATALPNALF